MIPAAHILDRPIEILGFWRARPGAFMVVGRAPGPLPKTGAARVPGSMGRSGVFRAEFWTTPERAGAIFVAVVRLPDSADLEEHATVVIHGPRASDRDIVLVLHHACSETEFAVVTADLVAAHAAQVARFLLDVVKPQDGLQARPAHDFLTTYLARTAIRDGCIESMLAVPNRLVLLQGWGSVGDETVELLLPTVGLPRYEAAVARFARSDVSPPAGGLLLALPHEALGAVSGLETVFVLAGDRLLARQIINPSVLSPDASIGQLRHLLPRLTGAATTMEHLRLAAQPQYEGHDTLASSGRPIRAALDRAICVEGAGSYLSGWVFDPAGEIAEMSLCWTGGAIRIDTLLVRIAREDVSKALRNDSRLPPQFDHEHGFAVACTAIPAPLSSAHFSFKFSDGGCAFLPLCLTEAWSPAIRRSLLQSVDMHKPSGMAVIEHHLAPFLSRIRGLTKQPGTPILLGPVERSHAIVVALTEPEPPRAFLSTFLRDAPRRHEQIVFVAGAEWGYSHHQALIDLIDFYELPASIIADDDTRPAGVLATAAFHTKAESLLLVSPHAAGSSLGWRDALYAVGHTAPVACPTILYEDQSVRFAGGGKIQFTARAPYTRVIAHGAGLSGRAVTRSGAPRAVEGGVLACCLIRRSVVPVLMHSDFLATGFGQETSFFLALRNAGISPIWVPSVCVTIPEDDVDAALLPRMIDGWILKDRWGEGSQCGF